MTAKVVIIGGGVSGLATAYDLERRGHSVVVLERQHAAGGNAVSERVGGFLIEHGPSTMNAALPAGADFSAELELDGARCDFGAGVQRRYLVGRGRLHGIATGPFGFLTSGYLSAAARLRVMAEFAIPARRGGPEESVMAFCTRRFGGEFARRVIDPLVGGLYTGRAAELSVSTVFPKLVALERDYGSISRAVFSRRRQGGTMPGSRLFSWRGGMASLPDALAGRLGAAVRTGVTVRRIIPRGREFRVEAGAAGALDADAVVIATQPHVAAQLLFPADPVAANAAGRIQAPPLAVVFLGYARRQVDHPLDGLGFLIPEIEGRDLLGAQFPSTMFPGRAPAGHVAVVGYIGGARAPDLARLPAADLIALARAEFRDLIGARGDPTVARVRHWPVGIPQYRLGHGALVKDLNAVCQRRPGLFVTGNYLAGPSVAACLTTARETAANVGAYLGATRDDVPAVVRRNAT
ncbi:MAG: protoporphyrinogen oxidase [Alphaproteobacteria bacterium]|nr:protoporphyrinogen oxidase [Alphaproteobacteria bacterium]